jgi:type II secretion system protein H
MLFAIGQRQGAKDRRRAGFTLIELIVVMTMMVIVLGLVFPSLKGFFHGRVLENEAGRFLALTRLGQSRAISEGLPMELWINPRLGTYGLQAQSGFTESQSGLISYPVDSDVQVSVSPPPSISTLTRSNYWTQATAKTTAILPTIRFQPDGFISETSPRTIFFREGADDMIRIVETPNHLRYETQTGYGGVVGR